MYNILVVSEDPAPFDELTDSFRKDFFEIETKELSTFENNFEELKHYDFVLLHLISESEEEKKKDYPYQESLLLSALCIF